MSVQARESLPEGPPLVGRQRELTLARFEIAAGGHMQVLLAAGEPGIGKTRLLAEVEIGAARACGAIALRGGASEIAGMPPYLPFLEALGALIQSADLEQLRTAAGADAPILATILPELPRRLGDLPAPYPLLPEQARLRLFSAVGSFLAALAAQAPVILLFDDLHWADAATLDLLCHVASHQPRARVLIAGAYRTSEAAANPALGRAIDHLNRLRLLTTVALSPLSADEIVSLAGGYLGGAVDASVGKMLNEHSEGNPFFAEELLRSWVETSGVSRDGERWVLTPSFDSGRIPPGIIGTIHQRLLRLPPDVIELLGIAAVIGKTFPPALVADVAGRARGPVDAGLEAASRAALIRGEPAGAFAFAHDKIRETLYAELSPGRRARLHDAAGCALESRNREHGAADLAALAFHFARGGDRARGVTYSMAAGKSALDTYAADDARLHYRTALDLADPEDTRRVEMLLGLGDAATLAEGYEEAMSAYERAVAEVGRAGDASLRARALRKLGEVQVRVRTWQAAHDTLQEAVSLLEPTCGGIELVHALAELAQQQGWLVRYAEGISHARRALQLAIELGDARAEAKACRALGGVLARLNDVSEALRLLERGLALGETVGDPNEAAMCCFFIAFATMNTGQLRRCWEISRRRLEFARRCHDPYLIRHAETWLLYVAALRGDWPEAERLARASRPMLDRLEAEWAHRHGGAAHDVSQAFFQRGFGYMAFQRGDYAAAEREFGALHAGHLRLSPGLYHGLLGLAQLALGQSAAARTYVAEEEELLARLPAGTFTTAPILTCLASMALLMDDEARLVRYYPSLLAFEGQAYWFLVDRILAAIEVRQGAWDKAKTHLCAAEELARREEIKPELPLVLVGRADLELARGGSGSANRARTLLAEALELLEEAGMAGEAARVRDRLRTLPTQPGSRRAGTNPAGLSDREVEVLRLVVAGLSNRQIAQKLALSEKTVANHLTAILNKTGTDNRTAATTFALRQGLA